MKNSGSCHFSAQNIDCGYLLEPPRRGGSNEYLQFMFVCRNKKINVSSVKPSFTKLYRRVFVIFLQIKMSYTEAANLH